MSINVIKLTNELLAAGLPIVGVAETGRIDWDAIVPTVEQLNLAQSIMAAHDPYDYEADIRAGAIDAVKAIPSWASWTEEEVLQWLETNIQDPLTAATSLAQAKAVLQTMLVVMRAQSRLLVALRNERWPNLEGK